MDFGYIEDFDIGVGFDLQLDKYFCSFELAYYNFHYYIDSWQAMEFSFDFHILVKEQLVG
jgi:hypothetical protein